MCVVSQKKDYLFLNGGNYKITRAGEDLSNAYNNFSVTQIWAKIFEIKVEPVYHVRKWFTPVFNAFYQEFFGTGSILNSNILAPNWVTEK